MGDLHDSEVIRRISQMDEDDIATLTEREKAIYEHHKMHEKHKGHEKMHMEMFLILIIVMFIAQVILVKWKQMRPHSYQLATLFGMWIIPPVFCFFYHWFRFIAIWTVFSIICMFMGSKAMKKPVRGNTPRLVYRWFLIIHQISYALGIIGYVLFMLSMMGFNLLFLIPLPSAMDFCLLIIFYGLYYGVVGRDMAEVCSEKMASHIGFYNKKGLPNKQLSSGICAVCGNMMTGANPLVAQINELQGDGEVDFGSGDEKVYKLDCGHTFHEFCIRGWCVIGKKQTCPYCKEKVDLKRLFPSPWEKPHVLFGNLLDYVRYLVAWQPVILIIVQGINWMFSLE